MSNLKFKITAIFLSIFIFALFTEVVLRITKLNTPSYCRPDFYTGSRLMENSYYLNIKEGGSEGYINSKGLRDYEYAYEKPEDVFRILIFGDSYTEAMQVAIDSSFIKIIEQKLNLNPPNPKLKYEVINFGLSGFGTDNSYFLYLSEGVKYNPDLVILAFYPGNDFRNNSKELEKTDLKPFFVLDENENLTEDFSFREKLKDRFSGWRSWLRGFKNSSYLVSLIIDRKEILFGSLENKKSKNTSTAEGLNIFLKEPPEIWNKAIKVTQKILVKFRNEVEKNHSKFLLVVLTSPFQISDKLLPELESLGKDKYELDKPNKILNEIASKDSIEIFQLFPIFKEKYLIESRYFHGFNGSFYGEEGCECHWNYAGHKLAGEEIYNFLINSNLIN